MSRRQPRKMSLVKFDCDKVGKMWAKKYPFKSGRPYVFLGEIVNMRGHCVVADHRTGRIYSGYHTENFKEFDEDEV